MHLHFRNGLGTKCDYIFAIQFDHIIIIAWFDHNNIIYILYGHSV